MQLKFSVLVPHSELRNFLQDMFQTSLTPEEAGRFIYNFEYAIQDGIIIKDAKRSLKESIAPPETITFTLDLAQVLAIGILSSVAGGYIFSKLQKASWLKIGDSQSPITLEDIRRIIREELEKLRDNDPKES